MKLNYVEYTLADTQKRLAYWSAGSEQSQSVVFCVHGLLRHSRDFDELVAALSHSHYVIAVDLPGRGLSDWFDDPADYEPYSYLEALSPLLAQFEGRRLNWVGTSLGGLMGMALAAGANTPISRLVINDIGAELPIDALRRIASYSVAPRFSNLAEVESYLRLNYPSYAALADPQWQRLAAYGSRPLAQGGYALHFDPRIADNTRAAAAGEKIELWDIWQSIKQPCLLVHGLESDLLTPTIRSRMQAIKTDMSCIEIPGVGHAPPLMTPLEVNAIVSFVQG